MECFLNQLGGFTILFQEGLWKLIAVFVFGILSVFAEKRYKNISITYLLFWYFTIPICYTISVNYSVLKGEITLQTLNEKCFYGGFYLFALLSIIGFITWIKERYIICKICCIAIVFFYFPFLFIASIVLGLIAK